MDNLINCKVPFSNSTKFSKIYNYDEDQKIARGLDQLPEKMVKCMFEFQKVGVQFGISKFGRVLLGDEMGVGKTIQALGVSYAFKHDWPLLIIVPASLKF